MNGLMTQSPTGEREGWEGVRRSKSDAEFYYLKSEEMSISVLFFRG